MKKKKDIPMIAPIPVWPHGFPAGIGPIPTDPQGSYTGVPEQPDEEPVQDADDL